MEAFIRRFLLKLRLIIKMATNLWMVALQMNKESNIKDKLKRLSFNLSVDPNIDTAFIFALFVIRDHVHAARRQKLISAATTPLLFI